MSQFTNPDFRSRTSIRVFTLTASISFLSISSLLDIEGRKDYPRLNLVVGDSRHSRSSFGKLYLREVRGRDRNRSRAISFSPECVSPELNVNNVFRENYEEVGIREIEWTEEVISLKRSQRSPSSGSVFSNKASMLDKNSQSYNYEYTRIIYILICVLHFLNNLYDN